MLAILEELIARVERIRRPAYATDAGKTIFVGETPQLGKDDPDEAIAIVPNDTQPQANRMEIWPIEIQALAKADVDEAHIVAMRVLGDIVKAVEAEDDPNRTLGGLVKRIEIGAQRTLRREPGSTTVGIGQAYFLFKVRDWGSV